MRHKITADDLYAPHSARNIFIDRKTQAPATAGSTQPMTDAAFLAATGQSDPACSASPKE